MARPCKEIDEDKLEQLASLGLSNTEIASVLDCSHDLIEQKFHDVLEWGRQKRNASLRRKQFEIAISGNPTMLIWLGKQFLDQTDKNEFKGELAIKSILVPERIATERSKTDVKPEFE
jgi:hypothetical protein